MQRLTSVTVSSTANATNEWVEECELMIRKRAKGELFQNELRNKEEAAYWFVEAEREYRELIRQNIGRRAGYVRPTTF